MKNLPHSSFADSMYDKCSKKTGRQLKKDNGRQQKQRRQTENHSISNSHTCLVERVFREIREK